MLLILICVIISVVVGLFSELFVIFIYNSLIFCLLQLTYLGSVQTLRNASKGGGGKQSVTTPSLLF